jgi:hypothetical protein
MSYKGSRKKATEACNRFEEAREAITEYIGDHQQVFDIFFELAERYNHLHGEAKTALKGVEGNEGMAVGSFTRHKAPESYDYTAHALPMEVLTTPGVIGKINSKAIEQGLISGQFTAEQINDFRKKVFGTPRVVGPAEIKIKVG